MLAFPFMIETVIPKHYRWASFEHPELRQRVRPPSAIELAKAAAGAPMVVITGPTGVGKTSLAAAMAKGSPSLMWLDLSTTKVDLAWAHREDHTEWRNAAMRAPLLIIDYLGRLGGITDVLAKLNDDEPVSGGDEEWAEAMDRIGDLLETVLHARQAADRRTIVTTTETESTIAGSYSLAISRWIFGGARIELDPTYDYTQNCEDWTIEKGEPDRDDEPF